MVLQCRSWPLQMARAVAQGQVTQKKSLLQLEIFGADENCCFARCFLFFFHEVSGCANSWRWLHLNLHQLGNTSISTSDWKGYDSWHFVFVASLQIQTKWFTCWKKLYSNQLFAFSLYIDHPVACFNSQILPIKYDLTMEYRRSNPNGTQRYHKFCQWIGREILQETPKNMVSLKKKNRFSNPTHWFW